MKESMYVAKNLALSIIPDNILNNIKKDNDKFGIHIHCPSGATPKDGPSAGTAITVAIISLLCEIPIYNEIGVTGEIDLNGNVLPIGGLGSKIDGGKLAGLKNVICPDKNKIDVFKIRKRSNPPENDEFKITMIKTIYDALEQLLVMNDGNTVENYFKII